MAPDVTVPELVGEEDCAGVDAAGLDVAVAAPDEVDGAAGLLALAEPDEAPAGALAEAGLLAEPETPLS